MDWSDKIFKSYQIDVSETELMFITSMHTELLEEVNKLNELDLSEFEVNLDIFKERKIDE